MLVDNLATEADVIHRLGKADRTLIARILAIAPTKHELEIATGHAAPNGTPTASSAARIASLREILATLEPT